MEFFNYVMVLASVIVGLAVTQLLQGVGKLIQYPEREKLYWVHLLWVAVIFLNALVLWWWEFRLSSLQHWTFELYLFVIGFAVVLYLICVVLMPSDLGGYGSFRAYYYARRRWLFGLILLFGLMDFADSAVKGRAHLVSLGWIYLSFVAMRPLLLIAVMKSRNARLHGAVAIIVAAQLLTMAFLNFHTMQ